MNADKQLKEIWHMTVNNALSRMEILKKPADRAAYLMNTRNG
tara:strand:- start:462 stop:587 length:126 start_codon:yes stop_codon:yes gene_type:complete